MYGIIYKTTGPTGKVYIGQTTQTLKERKRLHKVASFYRNRRSPIQAALLDEGFSNFTWEQIDTAENQAELDAKEKQWIAFYKSNDPSCGYNATDGGIKTKYSKETCRKIGDAHRGKFVSEETRKKLKKAHEGQAAWNKGLRGVYKTSAETRKKQSEALRGKMAGEKHPNYGKRLSEEHRRHISEGERGEKHHYFGKTLSEEHRRKLSEAHRGQISWNKGKSIALSETEIDAAIRRLKAGESMRKIAASFCVSDSVIRRIKKLFLHEVPA